MRDFKDLKVGDRVWMVGQRPYYRSTKNEPVPMRYVQVLKVGRKYLTVKELDADGEFVSPHSTWDHTDFTREEGRERSSNGRSSGRSLYRDINHYHDEQVLKNLRAQFADAFRGYSPSIDPRVTADDLRAAAKLLRIELKEETK